MVEKVSIAACMNSDFMDSAIKKDYTIQNTTRRIVILQHYPDSRDMPTLTSINHVLREAGYNQSVKVTDKSVITRVYEF